MSKFFYRTLFSVVLLALPVLLLSQEATEEREYPNREDNATCFRCHGNQYFEVTSEELGETKIREMFSGARIDSTKFYESNHWSFSCLDCHAYTYTEYPHPREAMFEYMMTCMDCHDGDDNVEQYNFPQIVEEYEKSHHTKLTNTNYSCWSCHDPHSFKLEVRKQDLISKVVLNDNAMCLQCHSGATATDLILGSGLDPIVATHDWLPDTENHFKHVRCIECHGDLVEGVLVAHDILPAKEAVKTCSECHSADSRLLHSLYLYQIEQGRMEKGFFGGLTTSDSYVIGANKHPILNWISLLIFAGVVLIVLTHGVIRIVIKK